MTPEQRVAMQQALDALEKWDARGRLRIIDALRAELAKPELTPLTDDKIIEIAKATTSAEPGRDGYVLPLSFARAIEAAQRISGVQS